MEVELILNRAKLLASHPDKQLARQEIRRLVTDTQARYLGRLAMLVDAETWSAVEELLGAIPESPPGEMPLTATELTPLLANRLTKVGIFTIGDADKNLDADVLREAGWGDAQITELRLVCRKYLAPLEQQRKVRAAIDPEGLTDEQLLDLRIIRAIRAGGSNRVIARTLHVPVDRVTALRRHLA